MKWNKSSKVLPPSCIMVLVSYAGVSRSPMEISRSEYVREYPRDYPYWMYSADRLWKLADQSMFGNTQETTHTGCTYQKNQNNNP
jgi:hypothetical protein